MRHITAIKHITISRPRQAVPLLGRASFASRTCGTGSPWCSVGSCLPDSIVLIAPAPLTMTKGDQFQVHARGYALRCSFRPEGTGMVAWPLLNSRREGRLCAPTRTAWRGCVNPVWRHFSIKPISHLPDLISRSINDHSWLPNIHSWLPNIPSWLPNIHSRLPNHHSWLPNIHSRLPNIHSRLPNIHSRLPNHHSWLPNHHSRLPNHHSWLPNIHSWLPNIHAWIAELH